MTDKKYWISEGQMKEWWRLIYKSGQRYGTALEELYCRIDKQPLDEHYSDDHVTLTLKQSPDEPKADESVEKTKDFLSSPEGKEELEKVKQHGTPLSDTLKKARRYAGEPKAEPEKWEALNEPKFMIHWREKSIDVFAAFDEILQELADAKAEIECIKKRAKNPIAEQPPEPMVCSGCGLPAERWNNHYVFTTLCGYAVPKSQYKQGEK